MKSVIPIAIIGILIFSGFGSNIIAIGKIEKVITEKIIFSQPEIIEKENFICIDIPDANSNYWETGKPLLPVVSKVFTFPFGTKIESVQVLLPDRVLKKISKPIKPTPEVQTISYINKSIKVKKQSEIYYRNLDIYPKQQFSWRLAAGRNGKDHVICCAISIFPVQYNPKENLILYVKYADIKIKYIPPASPINFPEQYDLLILTPTEFESALQRLVDHKNQRNITTKLVTLDKIPSQGSDTQESIKLYIKDAIENWGIDFLILVGSGLQDEPKFPFRYAWIGDSYEDNFPSDLYYADIYNGTMGFSDWDFDEDGKFAEYPDDILDIDVVPDICLGKIPCDSVSELNAYIDKVIWYDKHNKMTNKIIQVGGDTFTGDYDGIYEGEYSNSEVLKKLPGYKTTKLWASQGKVTKLNIVIGFKISPDFYDFSGHGSFKSWATHPPNDHTVWVPTNTSISEKAGWHYGDYDLYYLRNPKKYPIVFFSSCSNNKYHKFKDCLSWKTIRHPNGGGIIAFGSSGIANAASGTEITERLLGWMEVHAFDELYKTKNLGEVWSNCVKDYYTTFESTLSKNDYKTMLELSMFGDPTLNAEDGDDPRFRSIDFPYLRILKRIIKYFPLFERLVSLIL